MWPIQKILMAENSLFLIFIRSKSLADQKWTKATDVIISGERQCQIQIERGNLHTVKKNYKKQLDGVRAE